MTVPCSMMQPLQEALDQVLHFGGNVVKEGGVDLVVCLEDRSPEVETAPPLLGEGQGAGEEDVEDHPQGPAVHLLKPQGGLLVPGGDPLQDHKASGRPALECFRGPFLLKQLKGNQTQCLLPLYILF